MAQLRDRLNQALDHLREHRHAQSAASDDADVTVTPGGAKGRAHRAHSKPKPAANPDLAPLWSYEGEYGPSHWATLSESYAACGHGHRQSPIDIRDGIRVNLDPIGFHYQDSVFTVVDTGHTIQVNPAAGNYIEVLGQRYDLVEFHFHQPSEEHINGQTYAMDVQLVHRDAQGHTAVVALLVQRGTAQPVVQQVWDNLPLERNNEVRAAKTLNPGTLLPSDTAYYTYMGSLTTPPCSEEVLWLVLKQPISLSDYQLSVFNRLYPMNARALQPTEGRLIKESN